MSQPAVSEAASRARALSRLLAHVDAGRVELDAAMVASLARLAGRCAMWSTLLEEVSA